MPGFEHGRLLLADANAVLGDRRSRADQAQAGNNEHASGGNGQDDSVHRGRSFEGGKRT